MALNYTASTDFNSDGEFSECELDVSWATLQVKKLLETSGSTTIEINGTSFNVTSNETFLKAVKAMVALNVSASIASGGCAVVSSLPLEVSTAPTTIGLDNVLGYWRINEKGPEYDATTRKTDPNCPIWDSSKYDNKLIVHKPAFDKSNVAVKYGLGLFSWSKLTIPDSSGELFSNTTDWTFHAKIFVSKGLTFELHKGDFKMVFLFDKIYVNNIGGTGKFFRYPEGVIPGAFDGTFIDLFLRKEGTLFKMDILDENGVLKSFGQVNVSQNFFAAPNDPIEIKGTKANPDAQSRQGWKLSWFSEVYILDHFSEDLSSSFNVPAQFRFVYDGEKNNFGANNWTDVETGKQVEIVGSWEEKIQGSIQPYGGTKYAKIPAGPTNYLKFANFDFTTDFTLSFWYRVWGNPKGLLTIVSGDSFLEVSPMGNQVYVTFNNTGNGKSFGKVGNLSGEPLGTNWHHLSVVKSNGRLAVFIDGVVCQQGQVLRIHSGGAVGIANSADSGMTNCEVLIGGHEKTGQVDLSDFSYIDGGSVRVDNAWDLGEPNDDSKITQIKERSYFIK